MVWYRSIHEAVGTSKLFSIATQSSAYTEPICGSPASYFAPPAVFSSAVVSQDNTPLSLANAVGKQIHSAAVFPAVTAISGQSYL